ncbi:MAG: hypothetical protein ACJ719_08570, partial [Nitrososphaeraceae archaeon]
MCIVTGPGIDLAIALIDRMKKLFAGNLGVVSDTKETVIDSVGNHFKFKYKTLSEIIAGLRDNGYVQSDGAEGALGLMILAFTKNKLLI